MLGSQIGLARRLARCLALAAATGCAAPQAREAPVSNTSGAPSSPRATEHDALVAAVLERFAADPKTLPDSGLLPESGPIYVLTEIGKPPEPVVRLGPLPAARRPYVGKTLAELQAEADRRNQKIDFIHFYSIEIASERASLSSGVDVVFPAQAHAIKMCCCSAHDTYEKRAGRWTFISRGGSICI